MGLTSKLLLAGSLAATLLALYGTSKRPSAYDGYSSVPLPSSLEKRLLGALSSSSSPASAPAPAAAASVQQSVVSTGPPCHCTEDYDPQCGADGQTYGNQCVLACANVPLHYAGVCSCPEEQRINASSVSTMCSTGATGMWQPVCTHGWTWTTSCSAAVQGCGCAMRGVCQYTPGNTNTAAPPLPLAVYGAQQAAEASTFPPATGHGLAYAEALKTSLLYFRVHQSGVLDQQLLAWRGDSCLNCRGPAGQDLGKGYLTVGGGDYAYRGNQEGYLVANLAWSLLAFPEGYAKAGVQEEAETLLRWGADHLLACWNSSAEEFVVAWGNSTNDAVYFGPFEEYPFPFEMATISKAEPGSEVAGLAAAALAASYQALGQTDDAYLMAAEQLYSFANSTNTSIADATSPSLMMYLYNNPSSGFVDELAEAATWLYMATNDTAYLADAHTFYASACSGYAYNYGVDTQCPAVQILLSQVDTADPADQAQYVTASNKFLAQWLPSASMPTTPWGLVYPWQWGGMRATMSFSFLALVHSQFLNQPGSYQNTTLAANLFGFAQYQVNYALGNVTGLSYVSGYGADPPTYSYHKMSVSPSISWPLRGQMQWIGNDVGPFTHNYTSLPIIAQASKLDFEGSWRPNVFTPYGALAGNALLNDGRVSGRKDRTYTEPTTGDQSPFVGAIAALAEFYSDTVPFNSCNYDLGWKHPNATMTSKSVNNTAGC